MKSSYKLYINGKWVDSKEGKTFKTYCPVNGEVLATCADAGKEDVDLAVKAASKAFGTWKSLAPAQRSSILMKVADIIDGNAKHLAMIETMDVGKPLRESGWTVGGVSDHFRYWASIIRAEEGRAVMIDEETLSIVLNEPLGVVGQILPWNFPFALAGWKLAPALATGNTVVIKPSSLTPLSLLEFAELTAEVLPPGVVNVITGLGSTAGSHMLNHDGFRKLSFTGSTEVGYAIAAAAAKKVIPATLELGGKSANIFFPDCPWEKATEGAAFGILVNSGQICCAGSRVFVHEDIYDRFLADTIEVFKKVKVGIPWEEGITMGPLISEGQLQKVLNYIEIGKKEGARLAYGGTKITDRGLGKGYFMTPTILADVDNSMRVAQEEIFGPVVVFLKFKDEQQVIKMANDSEYGLAGAVWTKDINRALRVARAIETGLMWVNTYNQTPSHAPFGGYKKSGIGREAHKIAIEHYTQKKTIHISLGESKLGLY